MAEKFVVVESKSNCQAAARGLIVETIEETTVSTEVVVTATEVVSEAEVEAEVDKISHVIEDLLL